LFLARAKFRGMDSELRSGIQKAGLPTATKHLFVCLGPDCCRRKEGEYLWEYMKRRLKDTALRVMRTKAECFRICTDGPLLVVYPEGTWYSKVTPARFERILQEHLINGKPVQEWIIARNDLHHGCGAASGSED
jgi:(2Fe-2S) ferredoxin